MAIVARMLTQEGDGIGGYMALAELGFNAFAPSLFNMFGVPGTTHIGAGAELQSNPPSR